MATPTLALVIVAGVAFLLLLWLIGIYNGLVRIRNEVRNAWSQIDVQLKRRHDLVPFGRDRQGLRRFRTRPAGKAHRLAGTS